MSTNTAAHTLPLLSSWVNFSSYVIWTPGTHVLCVNSSLTWGETNRFLLEVAIPISTKCGGMDCFLDGISAHRLPVKHTSWSSARNCMQCITMATNSPSETWLSMWSVKAIGGQAVGLEEEVSLSQWWFSSANGAVMSGPGGLRTVAMAAWDNHDNLTFMWQCKWNKESISPPRSPRPASRVSVGPQQGQASIRATRKGFNEVTWKVSVVISYDWVSLFLLGGQLSYG